MPFVGTVPAIKPACAGSVTRRVSVLGTKATVNREYTREADPGLRQRRRRHAGRLGAACLAGRGGTARADPVADADVAAELAPCFIDETGRRTDTIVLACTHFPLLLDRLERLSPWPVRFIDPAPAIARRVVDLIGRAGARRRAASARIMFTSRRNPPPALRTALARFGIAP